MDVETPPPLENGTKENNDKVQDDPQTENISNNGSPKPSLRPRSKKSRSRTPSQDVDEQKTLLISIKPMKEIKENGEKTEENKDLEVATENGDQNEEEPIVRRSKRIKEDAVKGEENKKENFEKSDEEPAQRRSKRNKEEQKVDDIEREKNTEDDETTSLEKKVESSPTKDHFIKNNEGSPKKLIKCDIKDVSQETEIVEMEPLVISDEAEPELQFDESSDFESDKGSPIIPRCHTRRSQTRNIPTPKTPKSLDPDIDISEKNSVTTGESENGLPKSDNSEENSDSIDPANCSTRVEVGSNITRLQFLEEKNSSLADDSTSLDDNNYLKEVRDRSLSETLRSLSARKPIRDDYRRKALRAAQERSDLNLQTNVSFESIRTGIKRKQRSTSPEEKKKFKAESPGFFTSPLAGLRSRFKTDVPTSTPKLTGYKDTHNDLHFEENHEELENGIADKKNWCTVM